MNFQTALRTCLTEKYAAFAGRASRPEYWWFFLAYLVVIILASLLGWVVQILVTLALIVPLTAAGFRRLQDTGRPGWWIAVPVALSLLSMLFAPGPTAPGELPDMGGMGVFAILGLVQLVVGLVFLWWLTRPSEPQVNAYGPPPGNAGADAGAT